jgi:hypothetical protein
MWPTSLQINIGPLRWNELNPGPHSSSSSTLWLLNSKLDRKRSRNLMRTEKRTLQICALLFALCTVAAITQLSSAYTGQYRDNELPAGTIVKLSMDSLLTSRDARVGDPFTATVIEEVRSSGRIVIPRDSKVKGRVASVTPAQRASKSGTLSIDFEQLVFPNGQVLQIEGQLTSLDEGERRQIDEEGRVSGGSSVKRNVVFIGGGAAGGAIIGAIAGGGKGAGVGAGAGAIIGVLGSVISKGEEAEVKSGQRFGMEINRSIRVPVEYAGNYPADRRDIRSDDRNDRRDDRIDDRQNGPGYSRGQVADYNSQGIIRRAQTVLRDQGYYKGPINGSASSTRIALQNFQRRSNLRQTGVLNNETALALGLVDENGVEVNSNSRDSRDSGYGRDSGGLALVRQARQQAQSMLDAYKRTTGVTWRTSNELANVSNLTEVQAQVLPALNNLNNSTLFVEQLISARAPAGALHGAMLNLMRQARQTNRLLDRTKEMSILERQWADFERNLRRISSSYQVDYDTAD